MGNSAWKLQDAKDHLSEVVEKSLSDGPQVITRRGRPTSVLISFEAYRKYAHPSFLKLCRQFVDQDGDLKIDRNRSKSRPVTFGE